jgi:phosphoribosylaminoimidazolecarboxamide formyltransferase/IMP cyclohydrolase
VSAYGGVIAANGEGDRGASPPRSPTSSPEVVVAPGFEPAACDLLAAKKNLRLLACPPPDRAAARTEWRQLDGGLLIQSADQLDAPGDDPASWEQKAGPPASGEVMADLAFAWRACRSVKSNAILIAIEGATVGVGMGQVNRVDAARLAVTRSKERAIGAVAASDAFFPFADGLKVLAGAGVRAIVEPGGSVRDDEVVQAAQNEGITLYFTGARHFFH